MVIAGGPYTPFIGSDEKTRLEDYAVSVAAAVTLFAARASAEADVALKGLDIRRTGLIPRYPADRVCPPMTSLYASWDDVDGSKREEPVPICSGASGKTCAWPAKSGLPTVPI